MFWCLYSVAARKWHTLQLVPIRTLVRDNVRRSFPESNPLSKCLLDFHNKESASKSYQCRLGWYSPNVTATDGITAARAKVSKRLNPVLEISIVTRWCHDPMKNGAGDTACRDILGTFTCHYTTNMFWCPVFCRCSNVAKAADDTNFAHSSKIMFQHLARPYAHRNVRRQEPNTRASTNHAVTMTAATSIMERTVQTTTQDCTHTRSGKALTPSIAAC